MKRLKIIYLIFLLPFVSVAQTVGYQDIVRYRTAISATFSLRLSNKAYILPSDIRFEVRDRAGALRANLSINAGVTKTDTGTVVVNIPASVVNTLKVDNYTYRLYGTETPIIKNYCVGALRLLNDPVPTNITPQIILVRLDPNAISAMTANIINMGGSGGNGGGFTVELDPTVTPTAVRDKLASLTGSDRLDAGAIKGLTTTNIDPTISNDVRSITSTRIASWDLAATQGGGTGFNSQLSYVQIGNNSSGAATYESIVIGKNASYTATWKSGTVIGWGASNNQQGGVSIGESANGTWSNLYGCADGSDNVNVGRWSRSYGWRTTAYGAFSHAGGQSSTAIGAGTASLASHAIALGRGAYAGNNTDCQNSFVTQAVDMYLSNGWAHRFPALPTTAMESEYSIEPQIPSQRPVRIHGIDALDARPNPSDFNVAGGNLQLMAGRGTGTGTSGQVQILTAPVLNLGQNTKNTPQISASFDASTTFNETRFLLYDNQTNTLKRVKVASADGQGRRVLYIE